MNRYSPVSLSHVAQRLISQHIGDKQAQTELNTVATVVASAADGLKLALDCLGAKGRTVIVPGYTCDRVVSAVLATGGHPQFVDIDPSTGGFDPLQLGNEMQKKPVAIIATHLFGAYPNLPALVTAAAASGTQVIEDASLYITDQSKPIQKTCASFSIYSFGRGKPWAFGAGGIVVANSSELTQLFRSTSMPTTGKTISCGSILLASIRDSRFALTSSRLVTRIGAPLSRERKSVQHPVGPLGEMRISTNASRYIASSIIERVRSPRPNTTHQSLSLYRAAFRAHSVNIIGLPGERIQHTAVTPSLALATTKRNELVSKLNRKGVDCPPYWQYSVAARMGVRHCKASEKLAATLFFLPLHESVDAESAAAVASILSQYELSAFS
jgi:dTDP-4-amino-4,6-dideoxygalactose transaminase